MAKLIINDEEVNVADGASITDACESAGVTIACGEGVCGACVITVEEGMKNLNSPTESEIDFLGESPKERLACQCKIKCGVVKVKF